MKVICKECNKEYVNLEPHITNIHGLSREEYDIKYPTEVFEEISEPIEQDELRKRLFDGEIERDSGRPLSEFLTEFNISEKDLRAVVRQYKGDAVIPVSQSIQNRENRGTGEAKRISDEYIEGKLEIQDSFVAEILVKEYGFNVIEVIPGNISRKKTWVLSK